jgi:hypothetical protein
MSAATLEQKSVPMFHEGLTFWENLIDECRSRIQGINAATGDAIRFDADRSGLCMRKESEPSTVIRAGINFEVWGPIFSARITGQETPLRRFPTAEVETPLAQDLDGSVVAIFDEGRSFSPADLARYLMQSFRRSFPGVALPC